MELGHDGVRKKNDNALEIAELFRALFCRRNSERLLLVIVEVAGVACALALGNEVGLHLRMRKGQTEKLERIQGEGFVGTHFLDNLVNKDRHNYMCRDTVSLN